MSFEKNVVVKHRILERYLLMGDANVSNKMFKADSQLEKEFSFEPGDVSIDVKSCFDLFKHCKHWAIVPDAYYNYPPRQRIVRPVGDFLSGP